MMLRYLQTLVGLFITHLLAGRLSDEGDYRPPSQPPTGGGSSRNDQPSGMAIATLILGIGAWTILPILGAYIGAVLGWIELQNIKRGRSPRAGKTITQIGFWLSVAQIVLSMLGVCAVTALVVFVFGSLGALLSAAGM